VAAWCAVHRWGAKRVLVVDWDIHHGNGTEHMFYDDPSVMYVSLHRHEGGAFYPGTGHAERVRQGGEGAVMGECSLCTTALHGVEPVRRWAVGQALGTT